MIEKHAITQFIATWTPTIVAKVGDYFHLDFQANLLTNLSKYMRVNLDYATWAQQQARVQARIKQ
jgi:hypothetical protein